MALTTTSLVETYLGTKYNAANLPLITQLVTDVDAEIESYCQRAFDAANYTAWIDGNGTSSLKLPEYPLIRLNRLTWNTLLAGQVKAAGSTMTHATVTVDEDSVNLFSIAAGSATSNALAISDNAQLSDLKTSIEAITDWTFDIESGYTAYPTADLVQVMSRHCLSPAFEQLEMAGEPRDDVRIDEIENSMLHVGGGTPNGFRSVFVDYRAGYESGSMPADLQKLATMIVIEAMNILDKDDTVQTEKIGRYEYETKSTKDAGRTAVQLFKNDLAFWMRQEI